jgi:hypothetical protein
MIAPADSFLGFAGKFGTTHKRCCKPGRLVRLVGEVSRFLLARLRAKAGI